MFESAVFADAAGQAVEAARDYDAPSNIPEAIFLLLVILGLSAMFHHQNMRLIRTINDMDRRRIGRNGHHLDGSDPDRLFSWHERSIETEEEAGPTEDAPGGARASSGDAGDAHQRDRAGKKDTVP